MNEYCDFGHGDIDACDICEGCRECGSCFCDEDIDSAEDDFYDPGEDDTMESGYA